MLQNLVQPLKGSIEVDFDPTGNGGDRLTPVLGSPPFHETDPDGTHLGHVEHRLVPLINGIGQIVNKFLIGEYF